MLSPITNKTLHIKILSYWFFNRISFVNLGQIRWIWLFIEFRWWCRRRVKNLGKIMGASWFLWSIKGAWLKVCSNWTNRSLNESFWRVSITSFWITFLKRHVTSCRISPPLHARQIKRKLLVSKCRLLLILGHPHHRHERSILTTSMFFPSVPSFNLLHDIAKSCELL